MKYTPCPEKHKYYSYNFSKYVPILMTFGIIFVSHSSTQPTSGICETTEYTVIAEYCTVE